MRRGSSGLRLNEHVLHTWDVAVALDRSATLPPDATALCVDNLGLIARYTAKPDGTQRTVTVGTTDPVRSFAITLAPDTVSFAPAPESGEPDVVMPAEAFVRLVYGRLDARHTPAGVTGEATLDDAPPRLPRSVGSRRERRGLGEIPL